MISEKDITSVSNTIQGDSVQENKKTLNDVAMEKELDSETARREKELEDFVNKELPANVRDGNITSPNTDAIVGEIPTLDKDMSKELEEKLKESKKLEQAMVLNRELVKQYKILENKLKDTIDIANERIKLANSIYKEEAEKNIKNMSDPKRVVLDDRMYLLNTLRNEYKNDKSDGNKQKLAQNLVLELSTLYPTIHPNDMVAYINNTQKKINNIGEQTTTAPSITQRVPQNTISRPRGISRKERGILG